MNVVLLHGMKFQAATWQELGILGILADFGMHTLAVDIQPETFHGAIQTFLSSLS